MKTLITIALTIHFSFGLLFAGAFIERGFWVKRVGYSFLLALPLLLIPFGWLSVFFGYGAFIEEEKQTNYPISKTKLVLK
jgi:hypothetical protein